MGYRIVSTPGGITELGTSSPIIISGLTNGTSYTFTVTTITNTEESLPSSATIAVTPSRDTSAPTISVIYPTTNTLSINFSEPDSSFGTIDNYEYSLDGGLNFTACSPKDTATPILVSGLTTTTSYNVCIRAINTSSDVGQQSNIFPITTKSRQVTVNFTTPGATTWTAPAGVYGVQYLVVGGGGGSGGCYSKINVLGDVPVQSTPPADNNAYWIYKGSNGTYTNGRLYKGSSNSYIYFSNAPVQLKASEKIQPYSAPSDGYYTFYPTTTVYDMTATSGIPHVLNDGVFMGNATSASQNVSGGSGGGERANYAFSNWTASDTTFYTVRPGKTLNIYVANGGSGGSASVNTETDGGDGETSVFDTITATGGNGGGHSRNRSIANGGGKGGVISSYRLYGGDGGIGFGGTTSGDANRGGYGGASAGMGYMGDSQSFVGGGSGGDPNTVNTSPTTQVGRGANGTGCAINSFANGIKGGNGIVRLKYYV